MGVQTLRLRTLLFQAFRLRGDQFGDLSHARFQRPFLLQVVRQLRTDRRVSFTQPSMLGFELLAMRVQACDFIAQLRRATHQVDQAVLFVLQSRPSFDDRLGHRAVLRAQLANAGFVLVGLLLQRDRHFLHLDQTGLLFGLLVARVLQTTLGTLQIRPLLTDVFL